MHNAVDMVLSLDLNGVVADVTVTHPSDASLIELWRGAALDDLVSAESRSKLAPLLAADAGTPGTVAPWRHINLIIGTETTIPLLMKFSHLPPKSGLSGLVLVRDLRPTVELSERFRQATLEMERRYESLVHDQKRKTREPGDARFDDIAHGSPAAERAGASLVAGMVAKLAEHPMDAIVSETVRVLERMCITEALHRTKGGEADAAQLLGISLDDLRRKLVN